MVLHDISKAETRLALDRYCLGLLNVQIEGYWKHNPPVKQVGLYFRKEHCRHKCQYTRNSPILEIEVGYWALDIFHWFLTMERRKSKMYPPNLTKHQDSNICDGSVLEMNM